jgi:hypothetical protein
MVTEALATKAADLSLAGGVALLGSEKDVCHPSLHLQSNGMEEKYIKMAKEHPQKVMETQKRDWDIRLPIFLLAYRTSTHTMGLTPERESRREFCLPCHRLFTAPHPPNKDQ